MNIAEQVLPIPEIDLSGRILLAESASEVPCKKIATTYAVTDLQKLTIA